MPARRLLVGRQLHGPFPERESREQVPLAVARLRVPVPRLETQRICAAHGGQTRTLHRSLHHLRPALGNYLFLYS